MNKNKINNATAILIALIFTVFLFTGCIATNGNYQIKSIPVCWVKHLEGDFSFSEKWTYREWVFRNSFGQLVCDGFCPSGIETMCDTDGRIIEDSLNSYYQLVDTAHYYYSMTSDDPQTSDTLCLIEAKRLSRDTVICFTVMGGGVYSATNILIAGNRWQASVEYLSPEPEGNRLFPCVNGSLIIDKTCLSKGIMKAAYQFTFFDSINNQTFTRKGKIYKEIVLN